MICPFSLHTGCVDYNANRKRWSIICHNISPLSISSCLLSCVFSCLIIHNFFQKIYILLIIIPYVSQPSFICFCIIYSRSFVYLVLTYLPPPNQKRCRILANTFLSYNIFIENFRPFRLFCSMSLFFNLCRPSAKFLFCFLFFC